MTTKELFKKDIASCSHVTESACIEGDIEVSVSSCSCLCSVELSAPLSNSAKAKEIIVNVDDSQNLVRYRIIEDRLVLQSSIWIDKKPTEKGLDEIFNYLLADFKSKRLLIEAFTEGVLKK